jgi:hypothetical protein
MKQIIKDFIVINSVGHLSLISWRCSDVQVAVYGCASLLSKGIADYRRPTNPKAKIGDTLSVVDYYDKPAGTFKVLAISLRLWDYGMPMGQRNVRQVTTENYQALYKKYSDQVVVKERAKDRRMGITVF